MQLQFSIALKFRLLPKSAKKQHCNRFLNDLSNKSHSCSEQSNLEAFRELAKLLM